jgi:hypothetical protein
VVSRAASKAQLMPLDELSGTVDQPVRDVGLIDDRNMSGNR